MEHLPPEAAVFAKSRGSVSWTVTEYLLSDVFHALTGNEHPARPKPQGREKRNRATVAALIAQRERTRQQAEEAS